jgi:hypothetical protein
MEWEKMKRLIDDFNLKPEIIIHAELNDLYKQKCYTE